MKEVIIAGKMLDKYLGVVLKEFQRVDELKLVAKYRHAGKLERIARIFNLAGFIESIGDGSRVEFAGKEEDCLHLVLNKIPAARVN